MAGGSGQRTYTVTWVIEVDAVSPEDAALQAWAIQKAPDALPPFFAVECDGETREVDLYATPDAGTG